ncbi:MAG: ABC transporter substrate-binding protein [Deltaproteobacteria bacterium]|nr:ABC transporter substrate-binding protein [Deltaproteobacteria bacterium]
MKANRNRPRSELDELGACGAALITGQPRAKKTAAYWKRQIGRLMFGLFAFLVSLPVGDCAAAERRLQIGFVSITSTNAPLWVAVDRGFLAQEGLDPELIFIGSGPTMLASMMAREISLVTTAGTAVMSAAAGGAPIKILATFGNRLAADFVARPGITRPEDLRDKRVGVQSMGGGIWMQALLALEHLGLEPVKDRLHIQAIGPQPQLAKALEAGAIDVTVLPTAFSQPLKARGYPVLLNFVNANIPLTLNSLIALKETVEKSPQLVERVMRGLLRAIAFIHHPSNRGAVTQILARRLRVEQRDAEEAYRGALETLERKPYPSTEGLLNIRRTLARSNPRVASIQVEDVTATRILRKLDDSGFIDALYKDSSGR